MTSLDSVLKSSDITLATKVCIVKAMVFPVVVYGCKSWTMNKASVKDLMLSNCGEGERTDTEAEAPIFYHLMQRVDSLEKTLMLGKIEGRRRRG